MTALKEGLQKSVKISIKFLDCEKFVCRLWADNKMRFCKVVKAGKKISFPSLEIPKKNISCERIERILEFE